jgi:cytokinin dehydrogenase
MPPSVEILQQFMQLASKYKIKTTCRGKGNSAYGQSQVDNGVAIDLSKMDISIEFDSENLTSVTVPAFKTWYDVAEFCMKQNKTVPVTVDNLDLTVAGTLSFGTLGGTSYLCGSGADNILSLDVVTLNGERFNCTKTENSELFNAVLCGMGQYGIIISATIPLLNAKKQANMHLISYDNPHEFLRDQKTLYDLKIFDHLKGFTRKKENNWEYVIEAVSYYDEEEDKKIADALSNLSPNQTAQSMSYWDFINMVTGLVKVLRESGKLNVPHPWYNILMPEHEIEQHLIKVLDTSYLTGTEPIIVYPMNSDHFQRPLFMKPESQTFYLLGVFYNTSFEATNNFPYQEVLERNKALYLEAKELGGCRYAVDAIPFTKDDWINHYGKEWNRVSDLKEKYDPDCLLSSGVNIFEAPCEEKLGLAMSLTGTY